MSQKTPGKSKPKDLMADRIKFENGELIGFKPCYDYFIIQIPNVSPVTDSGIHKTEKMIAQEMEGLIGEYFKVVAAGPECKWVKTGDEIFMIPPTRVISFKSTDGSRFAAIKEHVLIGLLTSDASVSSGELAE